MKVSSFLLVLIITNLFGTIGMGQKIRGTGLILSQKIEQKQKTKKYSAEIPYLENVLPKNVDLSLWMPPAGDQGNQNSCVAWAIAYALKSYQEKKEEGWEYYSQLGIINEEAIFSPAFIYNQVNNGEDSGCTVIDALNLVESKGIATWRDMPYDENDILLQPNDYLKTYGINYWRSLKSLNPTSLKSYLAVGYPILVGIQVDDDFILEGFRSQGEYTWNSIIGKNKSFHAVVITGYNDAKKEFTALNSFGKKWGNNGYFNISYKLMELVLYEAYIIQDSKNQISENRENDGVAAYNLSTVDLPEFSLAAEVDTSYYDKKYNLIIEGSLKAPLKEMVNLDIILKFYSKNSPDHFESISSSSNSQMLPDRTMASKAVVLDKNRRWRVTISEKTFKRLSKKFSSVNIAPLVYSKKLHIYTGEYYEVSE